MSPAPHPRMHGISHVQGGPDPIPGLLPGTATAYPDLIAAHPCLVHYWPCDEPSGNLVDRVGSWDLAPVTDAPYPLYGEAGPFTELPEYTSVRNGGAPGVGGDVSRFNHTHGTAPAYWTGTAAFAVEFWLYLYLYQSSSGGNYFVQATGSSDQFVFNMSGNTQLTVQRNSATVTDPDDLPLNAWQHIVGNYTGTSLELWRNGTLIGTAATTTSISLNDKVTFMNKQDSPWAPVDGLSAQLAIYDCALTETEIGLHLAAQDAAGDPSDGYVLTSDGAGGTTWQPPTLATYLNGA